MAVRRWVLRMKWKRLETEFWRRRRTPVVANVRAYREYVCAMCAGKRGDARAQAHVRGMLARGRTPERSRASHQAPDGCAGGGCFDRGGNALNGAAGEGGGARGGEDRRGGGSSAGERGDARAGARARDASAGAVLPRSRASHQAPDGCAAVGASTKVETPGNGAAGEGGGARGGEDRRGGGSGAGERGDARAGARARDASAGAVLPRSRASHQAPDGCAAVGASTKVETPAAAERLEKEAALEAAKIAEAEARAQANAATLVQAHVRGRRRARAVLPRSRG